MVRVSALSALERRRALLQIGVGEPTCRRYSHFQVRTRSLDGVHNFSLLEYLDKQSNVMGGPRKIRSRGSWSHIVSKATDA